MKSPKLRGAIPAATVLALLPIHARARTEELVGALKKLLGDGLISVIAYGSAVRGGYSPETSDIDLVIVLRSDTPEQLEQMGPLLRLARAAARVECLLLRDDEIARSADVFPLLYDDIRSCHAVLAGNDPFDALVIEDEHRRLRVEQELRDARVRLRRIVATEGLAGIHLAGPLERQIKQLRSPLFTLLTLLGQDVGDDLESVVRAASMRWPSDQASLMSPKRDPNSSLRALRAVLDGAIRDVDAFQVTT